MLAEAAQSTSDRNQVIAALKQASKTTGSDFHFLLGTAMRESSLKTQAQSSSSSACGLFQFVGQTWLGLVKEHGSKYGLGEYSAQISRSADGRYRVADPAQRQAILALRKDAKVAALMEGEYVNQSKSILEGTLGRSVCNGELYAAHFLGPAAACKLIQMNQGDPDAKAANAFPQAADANRSVFFHPDGSAKTVREVYRWALNQPNTEKLSGADADAPSESPATFNATAASPSYLDTTGLLAGIMTWTPHRASFSTLDAANTTSPAPLKPFLLTPGVMDILSSVSPTTPSHA
jgi:hypothetical protein